MNITAKVDYRSVGKKWSDIKAHVDRLHKNGHYSNTNINLAKSDFNYQGYLHNAKKDNDYYFLPYIKLQNIRKRSIGHKKEVYKSVHDYFKHRGYSNQRNSMFEIGNRDYRKKYYKILENKGLTPKQIRKIEAKSLVDDVIDYDKNSCQSVGAFSVNCDESTAHIHFQNLSYPPFDKFGKSMNIMPRGKKWKRKLKAVLINLGAKPKVANNIMHKKKFYINKPSASFNNTWQLEFPNAKNKNGQFDSSKALHLANDKYSKMIIHNFNKELSKAGVKDFHLNLIRTHNVNHKNYKQFQSSKIANDRLRKANESLVANNRDLKANQTSIFKSIANNAVSNAEPRIHKAINTGTSSASVSASISANASISATVSSINNSLEVSNAQWQASINNSLAISASVSASNSVKSKNKSLASKSSSLDMANTSFNSKSATFDSSAYGGYAKQLKKITPKFITNGKVPKSSEWIQYAKGKKHFKDRSENRNISDPLTFIARRQASTANKATSNYYYWSASTSNITSSAESVASASSSVNSFHNKVRNDLDNFNYDYGTDTSQMPDNKAFSTFHKFFKRLKKITYTVDHMLKKYVLPNKFARKLLRRFINNNDSAYSNDPKDNRPNANNLKDSDVLPQFNYTAETMHNQREANLNKQHGYER